MKPIVAYLDQKDWITLGKIKHGKLTDNAYTKAYETIQRNIHEGNLITPISVVHLTEIGGSNFKDQRSRLGTLMYEFSNGFTVQPFEITLDQELNLFILRQMAKYCPQSYRKVIRKYHQMKLRTDNPRFNFLGKGIPHLLGGSTLKGQLVHNETGEVLKEGELLEKITREMNSLNGFLAIVESNEVVSMYQQTTVKYASLVSSIDKFRIDYLKTQRKKKRDDVAEASFFMFQLGDEITKKVLHYTKLFNTKPQNPVEVNNQIYPFALNYLPEDQTKKYMRKLFKTIPTAYCLFKLEYYRDQHFDKSIQSNDVFDTNALSSALPYCDVIVCERFFGRAIKQENLNIEFGTEVFLNIIEFASFLEQRESLARIS